MKWIREGRSKATCETGTIQQEGNMWEASIWVNGELLVLCYCLTRAEAKAHIEKYAKEAQEK